MLTPPLAGTFSSPADSIFQHTLLMAPTVGRNISSTHCGSIGPMLDARTVAFFPGNVSVLFKSSEPNVKTLQRPLAVDKFDVNSRHAVGARAARAHGRVHRDAALIV